MPQLINLTLVVIIKMLPRAEELDFIDTALEDAVQ
jgi:hypothetical protein